MKRNRLWEIALLVLLLAVNLIAVGCSKAEPEDEVLTLDPEDEALAYDVEDYTTLNVTVDGEPMEVRQYYVVYVAKPIKMASSQPQYSLAGYMGEVELEDVYGYQSMYIWVPESSYDDASKAIMLMVNNGGWFTSTPREVITDGGEYVSTSDTDFVGEALKAGYIVVNAGTRSRSAVAEDGSWAGKAPAVVVDAKAAVRYLRLNDEVMPGSAERIVITGVSGGGGLSVAVAASGNSPDYFPYLEEIGAAGINDKGESTIRDDVYATVAYCPITDLGNADIAYEWQYNAVRTAENISGGEYPEAMQKASEELAAAYPAYLESLGLKLEDGTPLTADNMDDAIIALVKKEVEAMIAKGVEIPAIGEDFVIPGRGRPGDPTPPPDIIITNDWLTIEDGKVVDIDYLNYLKFVTATSPLKTVPAFDATAVTGTTALSGENSLFGPDDIEYANFSEWSWNNNEVKGDGSGPDDTGKTWKEYITDPSSKLAEQLKMINPMPYLNSDADSAPYWYVRHGMLDRDTSFAIEVALYYAILNDPSIKDVNFKLTWMQGHGGNYDVQEAFAWLKKIL